ncbi:uncharacterized protein B4U79_06278 [Dinothrombium tinctorium]|uniref:PEP-utilising enzyme mobile domain-containing protein n=1 Tax=Dinothrombium tinctorium TaxID=1965070 RepID=A0A3S3Q0G4_9ACAR|nr:uncharacterized protein B4U79_06278 [Dinothrombium tinctorium]
MNQMQLGGLVKGHDFETRNCMMPSNELTEDEKVIGSSVCVGKAEGRAIVAKSFGSVATYIGWSPYFSILAGVVTEIASLISHDAVIARKYGLPAIIGATNAAQIFKTGDNVLLTSEKGILYKIAKM